ncbi:MAG: antibiotic biosynthesis monooxygenase family protein [Syntrophaceae bacterium]
MVVRAMIKRWIPKGKEKEAIAIITALRLMASRYPGYISGETLHNVDEPQEYLVISTWQSLEAWNAFFSDPKRIALQERIDVLQGATTEYKLYRYPEAMHLPLGESFD